MDFRMRNFKENKQNYNSMVEFPRNVDLLASNGVDYAQNNKFKQMEVRLSNLMESQRVENQNSSNLFFKIEQRVEGLELRIAALDTRFYNVRKVLFRRVKRSKIQGIQRPFKVIAIIRTMVTLSRLSLLI
jgi:hypothetical protein